MSRLFKVKAENTYSNTKRECLVLADSVEEAIMGAGVSTDEVAETESISKMDLGLGALKVNKKPNSRDMANFYEGIVECLSIGTSMVESLGIVSLQQPSPYFRGVIGSIMKDIRGGQTVSDALSQHPEVFSEATVSIVRAGETSGDLKGVMAQLARYEDRTARLEGKLKGGLTYPAVVAVMTFISVMFISIKLIPAITAQYKNFHAELPMMTKVVIAFSDLVRTQPLFWVALVVTGVYIWSRRSDLMRSPLLFKMMLRFPVVGNLYRKMLLARMFRVLSMLLEGGARIGRSFEIAALTTGSQEIRAALLNTGQRVTAGAELHVAFSHNQHIFGKDASRILAFLRLATHTGTPGPILTRVADATEAEAEAQADVVNKLMEPLLLAMLSVVIGGIIFAVYFPLFNLGQVVFKSSGIGH